MEHVKTPIDVKEEMLSVHYWRDEFERLYALAPDFQRTDLIQYDDYFLMAKAKDDVSHVKKGESGLEKTRRVVIALQKLVDSRERSAKSLANFRSRQKLVKA
ncbi:hypothetical protein GCM10011514_06090 [Emticicia aquatilis]|uniref:Uncharacterized protein n=1 Tax=Emticicia aquatilis TaxID=1537369 RepID=A0A916YHG9_9BACT|nr:hypothetical protein [Emticicia aquatilis]GGD44864.1 hypothetical protein GCM10011514_06090 [Emticicia aquatilis]